MNWALQEQQDRLNKVVDEARRSGPQIVTQRGEETAVVLSIEEYRKLAARPESLLEFFQNSPLRGVELDLSRDQDFGRDITL